MGNRKLFTGQYHYTSYMRVISEIIKEHENVLIYYEKVEKLGSQ